MRLSVSLSVEESRKLGTKFCKDWTDQILHSILFDPFDRRNCNESLTEYRSKRSAAGANVVDEATTAKRGERDLYRLLRTLKKRGGPGRFGNRFMQWLVHKREVNGSAHISTRSKDSRVQHRGPLQKEVRLETYLPVGTFRGGWYVYMIFHDVIFFQNIPTPRKRTYW